MKSNLFIAEYFTTQGCLNIDQGVNLWHLLNQVLLMGIPGDVVELGCLSGRTAAVMARTLRDFGSRKGLYLYDSFEGLPEPTAEDVGCPLIPANFKVAKEVVLEIFGMWGLPDPIIVPGWFRDTLPNELPEVIAFAHLDGDLYRSVKESLEAVYPRLAPGAVVLVDDYAEQGLCERIAEAYNGNPYTRNHRRKYLPSDWLPGVRQACDEFLADKPEEMTVLIAGDERHGFFRKM